MKIKAADSSKHCEVMRFPEFITLMALMMSLGALSIDAMLPALPQIGADLFVAQANDNQLIIAFMFLGFAIGQIFYGPLSDSFGRKPAIHVGFALAMIGCLISIFATSFAWMLVGRVLQGLGFASARIITIALIRDLYHGREMAKVMSLMMMIFILVPTIAPAIGQGILLFTSWHMIFVFILVLTFFTLCWFALRQTETLPPQKRTPFSTLNIITNIKIVLKTPTVLPYTLMAGFVFSAFLGYLNTSQQILQEQYQLGTMFPLYFAALALTVGAASFTNAKLVMRYGMAHLSKLAFMLSAATSICFALFYYSHEPPLWIFMGYLSIVLFCFGILMGNLNALAMEPLGKMAGTGASVTGAISTFISVPFGIIIGQSYNLSVLPLVLGFAFFSCLSLILFYKVRPCLPG